MSGHEYMYCSICLSIYLTQHLPPSYLSSFKDGALLAEGGKSGNMIYDFFIGR